MLVCLGLVVSCQQEELRSPEIKQSHSATAWEQSEGGQTVALEVQAHIETEGEESRAFPFRFERDGYSLSRKPKLDLASLQGQVEVTLVLRHRNWADSQQSLIYSMQWSHVDGKLSSQGLQLTLPTGLGTSKWGTEGWRMMLFAGGEFDTETGNYSFSPKVSGQQSLDELLWKTSSEWRPTSIEALYMSRGSGSSDDPWHSIRIEESGATMRFLSEDIRMISQGVLAMVQVENISPVMGTMPTSLNLKGLECEAVGLSPEAYYHLQGTSSKQLPSLKTSNHEFSTQLELNEDLTRPRKTGNQDPPRKFSAIRFLYLFPSSQQVRQPGFRLRGYYSTFTGTGLQRQESETSVGRWLSVPQQLTSNNYYYFLLRGARSQVEKTLPRKLQLEHPIQTLLLDGEQQNGGFNRKIGPGKFSDLANTQVYKNKRMYEMGSEEMLRILVPGMQGGIAPGGPRTMPIVRFRNSEPAVFRNLTETIQAFEMAYPFVGHYNSPGGDVSYAIRFEDPSGATQNRYRSAYRYERKEYNGIVYLEIKVWHLGDRYPQVSVDAISNENYWRNKPADVTEYIRNINPGRYWSSSGMPVRKKLKLVARILATKEPHEQVDRSNGAFVTDYATFRQWADLERNADHTFGMLFTRQR